ncbi:MAG TPA: trehalose-phosphatase [Deltaproteobacteria bacterium]|nr:trehalose-phosphatase [Deltaproteobacteria bacterium]HQI00877.1 trehalose-phosphatase [Deltaproteobacteria bacterium]HQJ08070.1 trehalose-phosphatase [Deltaproteobacteria bacterium]
MSGNCARDGSEVIRLPYFWDVISHKRNKLLALDYDGTLAPFRSDRMEALPLDGVLDLLTRIDLRRDTDVAVVSGRPLEDLQKLLNTWKGFLIGSHGFEMRSSWGTIVRQEPTSLQRDGLTRAYETAVRRGVGRSIEVKPASIALHTRGVEQGEARILEDDLYSQWDMLSLQYSLETMRFNGGVEVRAKGYTKGDAVVELLREEPPGTFCVYIGDDTTDEDVFERIRTTGVGIRVGDPSLPTAASGFLCDVYAVREFLEKWSSLAEEKEQGQFT